MSHYYRETNFDEAIEGITVRAFDVRNFSIDMLVANKGANQGESGDDIMFVGFYRFFKSVQPITGLSPEDTENAEDPSGTLPCRQSSRSTRVR